MSDYRSYSASEHSDNPFVVLRSRSQSPVSEDFDQPPPYDNATGDEYRLSSESSGEDPNYVDSGGQEVHLVRGCVDTPPNSSANSSLPSPTATRRYTHILTRSGNLITTENSGSGQQNNHNNEGVQHVHCSRGEEPNHFDVR